MHAIIKAGSALMVSLLLMNGCSSKEETASAQDTTYQTGAESAVSRKHYSQKKMHQAIIDGGQDAGWIMTPFKNNAVVAEYLDGDDSLVVTIIFDRNGYDFSPESDISDLREAIDKRLEMK